MVVVVIPVAPGLEGTTAFGEFPVLAFAFTLGKPLACSLETAVGLDTTGLLSTTLPTSFPFSCLFIDSFCTVAVAEIRDDDCDDDDDGEWEFLSWEREDWRFAGFGCCGCDFSDDSTRLSVDREIDE